MQAAGKSITQEEKHGKRCEKAERESKGARILSKPKDSEL